MEKQIRISNNLNEIATLANFIEELGGGTVFTYGSNHEHQSGIGRSCCQYYYVCLPFPGGAYHSTKSDVYSQTTRFPADRQRSFL